MDIKTKEIIATAALGIAAFYITYAITAKMMKKPTVFEKWLAKKDFGKTPNEAPIFTTK